MGVKRSINHILVIFMLVAVVNVSACNEAQYYAVRVEDKITNEGIKNAKVITEMPGIGGVFNISDDNGYAHLSIPNDYLGKPGRLIVEADGYKVYSLGVNLDVGKLPTPVLLEASPPDESCLAYLENSGTVVIDADHYIEQVPGRKSSLEPGDPLHDASGISWQQNPDYPNTLQAIPDTQDVNTLEGTNGPALVYIIDFKITGRYYVYIRGYGPNDSSDSIHIGLGGIPVTTEYSVGFSLFTETPIPRWFGRTDSNEPVYVEILNPGLHTFYIWMRENGVNVQRIWLDTGVDKIWNGDDTEGPPTSKCKY